MVFSVKIIRNYKINGVNCMSETHKYGGTWRLFEKEQLYHGELHINFEKRVIALEILIPASDEKPIPRPPYKGKIPFIYGTLFSGAKILLYQCSTGKEHSHVLSHTQQIIYADYAFWGLEVKSEDEIKFSNITFDFGEIIDWSGLCRYNWDFSEDGGSNLLWIHKKPVTFNLNENLELTFYPNQGSIGGDMYGKEIKVNQQVFIQFAYKKPTTLDIIIEDALCIQYLIGLGINNKVEIDNVRYEHSSIYMEFDNHEGTSEKKHISADMLIGTGITSPTPSVRQYDCLFTLEDINKNDIFTKWKSYYSTLKPVLDLYFTAFSKTAGTSEMLFLNLTQALETYHARFVTDDVKEYIARVDKIVDNFCHGNSNSQSWKEFLLDDRQKTSKRIYLRSRLSDLIFAEGILPFWPNNYKKDEYIRKVVDTRNYYTHYDPEKLDKAFSKVELPFINGHLIALLQFHILVLIGFDTDEVRKKTVERIRTIDDAYYIQEHTHDIER